MSERMNIWERERISAPPQAPPGNVGLCSPWISDTDVHEMASYAKETTDYSWAAVSASEILYELSGRRFPGACQAYDRPGGMFPSEWWSYWDRSSSVAWDDTISSWTWPGWDPRAPGLYPMCESLIVLRGSPVIEVGAVLIDGEAVSDSTYQLEDGHYLRRIGGAAWPSYQNLSAADTERGTFSVAYAYGSAPPRAGIDAAVALAVEIQKARDGRQCALPFGVTQIARQGITITKAAMAEIRAQGFGLPLVDMFLEAWRVVPGAVVWSPDLSAVSPLLEREVPNDS